MSCSLTRPIARPRNHPWSAPFNHPCTD